MNLCDAIVPEQKAILTTGPGRPLSPGKPRGPGGPSLPAGPAGPGSPCGSKRNTINPVKPQREQTSLNIKTELQDSPWLLPSLQHRVDLAHQVGLGVQGGLDLPLVQSHLLDPTIEKQTNK